MSIGKGFVYVQFHPLVYLLKLHIEMNMADLIAKIVRVENPSYASNSGGNGEASAKADTRGFNMTTTITTKAHAQQSYSSRNYDGEGIHRKIETEVVHHPADDDSGSVSSSTAELKNQYAIV
jgi:hypothetical protein